MHQIKSHYKNDCICVFMLPPSLNELKNRLIKRGRETEEQIIERLNNARNELKTISHYDYFVVNNTDQVEDCATSIYKILKGC